ITSVTTKIIGGFVEATATLSEDFPRDLSMKCTYNDGGTTETVSSVLSNPRVGRQANKVINSSFQPKSANWSLAECSIFEYGKTEPLATYIPTTTPNKTLSPNATTVNISLSKGDNFISLPVIPANNSITTLISSIEDKIETIFLYNSADETWKGYIPGPAADDLSTLEPGKGYMIRMKEAATLTVTGDPYEFEPIALQANKQYPLGIGFSSVKVSETLGTCNLSDIQIQSVNSNGSTMEITLNPNTILETKKGYWIKSTNNCTLSRIPALSQIPSASPALSATPKSLQILLTVGQQGLSGLPINQNKKVTVFIRGDDGKVTKKTVTLPYKNNAVFGKEEFEHAFQGNIDLSALSIGRSYKIRVESGSFLKSRTINLNVSENTNSIIATLLVGLAENTDFTDKDNIDAISFFNGLKSCFGSTIANKKSSCSNPGDIDLTGDGNVDQFDFNIFIKGIQNLKQGLPIQ
ncbi:MAG: hypothetical protein Q8O68_01040, partial [Candidatus Daviesbacteria bacterium]|nr:hypothetical protein [Candidatus Daviesbacteria bacterium]